MACVNGAQCGLWNSFGEVSRQAECGVGASRDSRVRTSGGSSEALRVRPARRRRHWHRIHPADDSLAAAELERRRSGDLMRTTGCGDRTAARPPG